MDSKVKAIVVMGVCGSGKTTIGEMIAKEFGWGFSDADVFHPKANIKKMSNGIPLNDQDREPWLLNIRAHLEKAIAEDMPAIVTCSALKKKYRDLIRNGNAEEINFIYLQGDYETILERMNKRQHHFMKSDMLQSQFETLEEPKGEAGVLWADVRKTPEEIVEFVKGNL